MTKKQTKGTSVQRDPLDHWLKLELWPIGSACLIVYGENPDEWDAKKKEVEISNRDSTSRHPWANLFHQAMSAYKAGTLDFMNLEVKPGEFVNWARSKGVEIPQPIESVWPKQQQEESFAAKEREKVLQIILAMAIKKYGYEISATKNTATGENNTSIAFDIQGCGLSVSNDTVKKYLDEASAKFGSFVKNYRKR